MSRRPIHGGPGEGTVAARFERSHEGRGEFDGFADGAGFGARVGGVRSGAFTIFCLIAGQFSSAIHHFDGDDFAGNGVSQLFLGQGEILNCGSNRFGFDHCGFLDPVHVSVREQVDG